MLKELMADKLTVKVYESRQAMGQDAAKAIAAEINRLLETKPTINMVFAAAPSQNEVLEALTKEAVDFTRINAFHMDEYVGLTLKDEQSFGHFLNTHLFDLVPFKHVYYIAEYGENYAELLEKNPIDIVVLGIGENGHIAFNDPGVADFNDKKRIKVAELDLVCRTQQVHDGCFPTLDTVPTHALTLTIPQMVSAGAMFCVVPAKTKRQAVTRTVTEAISEACPATILRRHANATLFCDSDSGADLLDSAIPEKRLNVAIIGQGRSGRDIHGAFFRSEENTRFNVVAVVDALPDRRERAKQEYGCDVYEDYHELFGRTDIDLVVNSTFSYLHAPISTDLMVHGFNVICEKPFARTYEEGARVVAQAKKTGQFLLAFQQSRFAPYFTRVKEILATGKLGKPIQYSIYYCGFARRWDWQTSQAFGGGGLRNSGPHPLDQALALLDFDPNVQVFSRMDRVNVFGDAEDYTKALITAPGKPVVDLEVSSCNAYAPYVFIVSCERGSLRCTHTKIEYKYFDPATAPEQHQILTPLANPDGTPAYCHEKLDWTEAAEDIPGSVFTVGTKKYYDMVYEHLVFGKPTEITMDQVLLQLKVVDLIRSQNPLSVEE